MKRRSSNKREEQGKDPEAREDIAGWKPKEVLRVCSVYYGSH